MKICQFTALLASAASLMTCSNIDATNRQALEQKIQTNVQQNHYKPIDRILKKNATRKKNLAVVKKVAKNNQHQGLTSALQANKRLKTKNYGMSQGNFLKAAYFIETRLPEIIKKKNYYMLKKKTGLSNNIEYDPSTKSTFIILEGKKAKLGLGKKKIVTKAIHYNNGRPKVVARGEQSIPMKQEFKLTKKLRGKPGLFQTHGFGKHKAHGKKYTTIYSKLYSPGALQTAFDKKMKFSVYEKIKIAHNVVRGLYSLHKKGLVHRDLGARNYLINVPKGKKGKRDIEACIADLGRTDYAKHVKGSKIQGNTSYTAPEGLYRHRMSKKDYFKTDVFAVGCVLYRLFYEKQKAPWQKISYVKDSRPLQERYHEMMHKIIKATKSRRTKLAKKKHLSPKEELESVMLNMTHPYPKKRKTAEALSKRMDKLFSRVKKK